MTKKEIENAVDTAIESAISNDFISDGSSRSEVAENAYEISEFGLDIDSLTDSEYEYAEKYLLENF